MSDPLWGQAEALGTVAVAAFAAVQIFLSRREANRRAAFDYLKLVNEAVEKAWEWRIADAQKEVLAHWAEHAPLTDAGKSYLRLLGVMDLIALAVANNVVERKIVDSYLKTLLRTEVVTLTFLTQLRQTVTDDHLYEDLYHYFTGRSRQ